MNRITGGTVTERVKAFYEALPFNMTGDIENNAAMIRKRNPIEAYPNLHRILQRAGSDFDVLDLGCGTGWFANSVAYHYGLRCVGIDFCKKAIERCHRLASRLETEDNTLFINADLYAYRPQRQFPFVNSIGVLHHTDDCRAGVIRASHMVSPGGYLHFALYHLYGRRPFLNYFEHERTAWENAENAARFRIEETAYEKYRELNPHIKDETFLRSWFRDQVLHPHETQHTLKEVCEWVISEGLMPQSTSINNFKPVSDWETLFMEETKKEQISFESNHINKRYFPGFFTLMSRATG